MRWPIAGLAGLLLLAGCHVSAPVQDQAPGHLPAGLTAPFAYELISQELLARTEMPGKRYSLHHETVRSTLSDGRELALVIERYQQADPAAPGLIVLPIFGGRYKVARHFAHFYAQRGYSTFVVHREERLRESVCENTDAVASEMLVRQRLAIDWIEGDVGPLGVFGVSAGGIKAVMLLAVDARVTAGVVALAGADIALICTESNEKPIQREREQLMAALGVDEAGLYDYVRQQSTLRISDYAAQVGPGRVLQFVGEADVTVPARAQHLLNAALGKPQTVYMPTGHRTSLLLLPYIERRALPFLDARLKRR